MSKPEHQCPFTCLGLVPTLDLNSNDLDQAYFNYQKKWHPDQFAYADDCQRQQAEQMASAINTAYQRLGNFTERYWAVLESKGAVVDRYATLMNQPQFMEDMMHLQEQAADLTLQNSAEFYHKFVSMLNDATSKVAQLIENHQLEQGVLQMHWLTYLDKLQVKILQKFPHLKST